MRTLNPCLSHSVIIRSSFIFHNRKLDVPNSFYVSENQLAEPSSSVNEPLQQSQQQITSSNSICSKKRKPCSSSSRSHNVPARSRQLAAHPAPAVGEYGDSLGGGRLNHYREGIVQKVVSIILERSSVRP